MTNATIRFQITSSLYRIFWLACFAILLTALTPAISQAQQSNVLQSLQTGNTQSCTVDTKSCGCSNCGSCQSGPSCPSGYTVYDDYCLPECPGGYVRYPGFPGYCMPPCHHGCPEGYEPVPLPNCPDGYYRNLSNPDECLPRRTTYPDNCPDGMSYSQETGKCSPDCPDGTYLAENGLCHSYYEQDCPAGYNRNPRTGACTPGGDWPDDYSWICMPVCPQGFTRDIYHPTRCLPPPPQDCPQGFENFHRQCVPVCDQGTARNAYGYCVPPRCEDGSYPDLRGNCHKQECPQGYDNIRGQCYPPCAQGYQHNLREPAKCENIPGGNEPGCPQGTKRNEQTGNCDRIPPPPVNCKQGLQYNQRTKRCEPPPRIEKDCPPGFTKTKSGKCVAILQVQPNRPDCGRDFFFNENTGDCEPIRLNLPRACPDGTIFSRKRQRCVPFEGDQPPPYDPQQDNNNDPNIQLPRLDFNKNMLRQPDQKSQCPDGTAPDKNGRCMPIQ